MKDRTMLWLGGLGLGAIATGYFFRNQAAAAAGAIMDDAKKAIFALVIPPAARVYADVILRVAAELGVSPFLIVALGQRESGWGIYLNPPGPAGTGDGGHGHGLMQIDDGTNAAWLAANDWSDPYINIKKGVQIYKGKLAFFAGHGTVTGLTDGLSVMLSAKQASRRGVLPNSYPDPRPLSGDQLQRAAVAAYNTGEGNVLMSLAVGLDPDVTTAKGPSGRPDYSSDVLGKMASLMDDFSAQAA